MKHNIFVGSLGECRAARVVGDIYIGGKGCVRARGEGGSILDFSSGRLLF